MNFGRWVVVVGRQTGLWKPGTLLLFTKYLVDTDTGSPGIYSERNPVKSHSISDYDIELLLFLSQIT